MKNSVSYKRNVKKPQSNKYGQAQLTDMNVRHNKLSLWGLDHINLTNCKLVLDVGCGGGKNISNMLSLSPKARVFGVDYSQASVEMSKQLNIDAVKLGLVEVVQATAEQLPYASDSFDVVTAFETVYFWNLPKAFSEVLRVLKFGGVFMITNESCSAEGMAEMIELIGMEVYNAEQLTDALTQAGFSDVTVDLHENGKWINVKASKL